MSWYFKQGQQGDSLGYLFTKENIDEEGEYFTGLSVNVIPRIPQKKGMSPSSFANSFIETAINEK